jgi:hypothetical protein
VKEMVKDFTHKPTAAIIRKLKEASSEAIMKRLKDIK